MSNNRLVLLHNPSKKQIHLLNFTDQSNFASHNFKPTSRRVWHYQSGKKCRDGPIDTSPFAAIMVHVSLVNISIRQQADPVVQELLTRVKKLGLNDLSCSISGD